MLLILGFAMILIVAPCGFCDTSQVRKNCYSHKVESAEDYLTFSLSLPKKNFTEGEPIIAKLMITNNSRNPQWIVEPTLNYGIVEYRVAQVSGERPFSSGMAAIHLSPPYDFRWRFKPGESRIGWLEIPEYTYRLSVPPGEYTIYAVYKPYSGIKGAWHGRIQTPKLSFSVASPPPYLKEAAESFIKARSKALNFAKECPLDAAKVFRELSDPEKGGLFAKYAGYWEAYVYYKTRDVEKCLKTLEDYIKHHGETPHYGSRASWLIPVVLYEDGRYTAAYQAFLRQSDSSRRRLWLKKCEEKLTKAE